MDTLLRDTVTAAVNSRYPSMNLEGRRLIEQLLVRRDFEKGERILEEGQVSRYIAFIGRGMVRQFYYKNGKDITEHFSYEGCIVMCIESLLKQEPTRLMIEALEDGTAYMLPFDKLMLQTESLITSQVKADSWRFETARERYNNLLTTQPEVIKRAPLSHIASYLLMTPETLSRVRAGVL